MNRKPPSLISLLAFALAWGGSVARAQDETPEPEGPKITGQVLDHMGGGVEGATVSVTLPDKTAKPLTAETDNLGDFAISLPADTAGTADVSISKTGYKTDEREIKINMARDSTFIALVLEGDTRVRGVVQREADGDPIVGAKVLLTDGYQDYESVTDGNGKFEIQDLPPGGISVKVEAEGYGSFAQDIQSETRKDEEIAILLGPEWIAAIRVVGPDGMPVEQAIVEAMFAGTNGWRDGMTDGAGEIRFRGLRSEIAGIRVRVDHPDFARMEDFDVEIAKPPEGGTVEKTVTLQAGATLKGTVVENETGRPVEMARVSIGGNTTSAAAMEWTDFEGNFEITSVAPGRLVVTVHSPDWAAGVKAVDVKAGKNNEVEFRLKPGVTLSGRVVNDADEPVPQAIVAIEEWETFTTVGVRAMTGADGRFEIRHAPEGKLKLSVFEQRFDLLEHEMNTDTNEPLLLKLSPRPEPKPPLAADTAAPELTLTATDGSEIRIGGAGGGYVLLDFWATWCGPCVAELPNVKAAYQKLGGRQDFKIVGISLDRDMKAMAAFVEKNVMAWPQVTKDGGADRAADAFGVTAIPATFLIGPDGKILATGLGGAGMADQLKNLLSQNSATQNP